MWDGFDKRNFPRINVRCEVNLKLADQTVPFSTVTQNLGCGGLCVLLDHPMERFSECDLRLTLDDKSPAIACRGKVSWVIPTRGLKSRKTQYDTGIEFLKMPQPHAVLIRAFIETQYPVKGTRGF